MAVLLAGSLTGAVMDYLVYRCNQNIVRGNGGGKAAVYFRFPFIWNALKLKQQGWFCFTLFSALSRLFWQTFVFRFAKYTLQNVQSILDKKCKVYYAKCVDRINGNDAGG
jgi:hypothetical protein